MEIKGSSIIVTGGSSGIGKTTALNLINLGAKVLITGRDKEKLNSAAKEIGAIPYHLDMSDFSAFEKAAVDMEGLLNGVDVLVNNAGIGEFAPLENLELDQFKRVFDTNVFGLALFTKEVLKALKKRKKGSIVNIASSAALKGFAHGSVYAASKFALRGMTQCWQAELRKENIRVIGINPSEVPTAFNVEDRIEKPNVHNKLSTEEIAHAIISSLQMDDRGFIPELTVWATNPF